MLITRETDYALRLLRALTGEKRVSVGVLAEGEQVPSAFAYKILKKLERAGLVELSRGAEGGCRLTADLAQTSLYDLMQAMEEGGAVTACMEPGYECPWRKARGGAACRVHVRLAQVQKKLDDELRAHKLQDMFAEE